MRVNPTTRAQGDGGRAGAIDEGPAHGRRRAAARTIIALHGLRRRSGDDQRDAGRDDRGPRLPRRGCCARRSASATRASTTATSRAARSVEAIPIEDDYAALRREIWLRSDEAYKNAVETLARKRSAAAGQAAADEDDGVGDFSAQPAAHVEVPFAASARRSGGAARDRAQAVAGARELPGDLRIARHRHDAVVAGAGWRPARAPGSTTTSAPSASTSSPTRRPTTA